MRHASEAWDEMKAEINKVIAECEEDADNATDFDRGVLAAYRNIAEYMYEEEVMRKARLK